ncbi:hypothetical protein V1525DRAFT_392816, partial [Lipomyces kononenkoae]
MLVTDVDDSGELLAKPKLTAVSKGYRIKISFSIVLANISTTDLFSPKDLFSPNEVPKSRMQGHNSTHVQYVEIMLAEYANHCEETVDSENDTTDAEQTADYESSHTSFAIDDLCQLTADLKQRRQGNNVTIRSQEQTELEITEGGLARESAYAEKGHESKPPGSTIDFCSPFRERLKEETYDQMTFSVPKVDYIDEGADESTASTVIEPAGGFANIADFLNGFVDIV